MVFKNINRNITVDMGLTKNRFISKLTKRIGRICQVLGTCANRNLTFISEKDQCIMEHLWMKLVCSGHYFPTFKASEGDWARKRVN